VQACGPDSDAFRALLSELETIARLPSGQRDARADQALRRYYRAVNGHISEGTGMSVNYDGFGKALGEQVDELNSKMSVLTARMKKFAADEAANRYDIDGVSAPTISRALRGDRGAVEKVLDRAQGLQAQVEEGRGSGVPTTAAYETLMEKAEEAHRRDPSKSIAQHFSKLYTATDRDSVSLRMQDKKQQHLRLVG
jgi:hypothetical protein